MPVKEGKIYAELSQSLERMADGIDGHQEDVNFPPSVKNADMRGARQKLEDLAQKYEELLTKARTAYDNYSGFAKSLKKEYAGHKGQGGTARHPADLLIPKESLDLGIGYDAFKMTEVIGGQSKNYVNIGNYMADLKTAIGAYNSGDTDDPSKGYADKVFFFATKYYEPLK